MADERYVLHPVGLVRSPLADRREAPMQGSEGAPDATIEIVPEASDALRGLGAGDEVFVLTWLHEASRDVVLVHPRGDESRPLGGVFATRSSERPNPIGLHRVRILGISGRELRVGPLEAIDGTPVVDIKPVLRGPGAARDDEGA